MKKSLLFLSCFFLFVCGAHSQPGPKKYPSLFWEITGHGLSKPSYLFGTMHVSSKIVFHLPDSFYLAIKNVDVIALETNPESWQEDLVKYDIDGNWMGNRQRYPWNNFRQMPDDYLNIRSLQFDRYEKLIEAALYSRPSTINNLLYRNYSDYSSDFEENTYLDMYIYQVGKKMGKRVAGVEKYDESMKLMMEAYRDAAKDKEHRQRSYDIDESYSADKLQEAYRTGNLDLLDSINKVNSFSNAFDEKFLYRRNLLQANSIDSILQSKSLLFVGVGAAHLPGNRGVIEILRRMGYKLRPIVMSERDSRNKDRVEHLRVPVRFTTQTSDDGFIKVDIPGKFYRFNEDGLLDQLQYADMANGSYYMVTRIKTNSLFWGHSEDVVEKKIDSLLYENVPGKIIQRQRIFRNGYRGLDIVNRTRRGDVQRYNIFTTPFEVIIFKMSGNGEYVQQGTESKTFFGSIRLKEFKSGVPAAWQKFTPPAGGFSIMLPGEPFVSKNSSVFNGNTSWEYEATDKTTGSHFSISRTDIHNYSFAEEDSFDLGLLDESFGNSDFIQKQVERKFVITQGYPALECRYLHRDGSVIDAKFIIQGPHYYTLIAHAKKELPVIQNFFHSFEIKPLLYPSPRVRVDSALNYSVTSGFFKKDAKIRLNLSDEVEPGNLFDDDEDDDLPKKELALNTGSFKADIIQNDTTGERIFISFYRTGRYYFNDDSSDIDENRVTRSNSWITRDKKKLTVGTWRVTELLLSDTNSSRLIRTRRFYKEGIGYLVATEGDTLTAPSPFVKNFFESFRPADSLVGFDPAKKKTELFFKDFFSGDSIRHKLAIKSIDYPKFDSSDLVPLKKSIELLSWSDKGYLDVKKSFIGKLSSIKSRECSDVLNKLYYAAGDTTELQSVILESLLQQKTAYSFSIFKNIITTEPPVIESTNSSPYNSSDIGGFHLALNNRPYAGYDFDNGEFWDELYDSVKLSRAILPDLLPLLNLEDYKWRTMRLLEKMVDSNFVGTKDYETYFARFLLEAKQEMKKQFVIEKRKLIKKAADKNAKVYEESDEQDNSEGNERLRLYAKLLMPFWVNNPAVPDFFRQLLQSTDKKIRYESLLLVLQKKKLRPDSLLNDFAAMDDYRYRLYADLQQRDLLQYFPQQYFDRIALAKSRLLDSKSYGKPDSLEYISKLQTEFHGKTGDLYFFRYKDRKDDMNWKLAVAGLVSTSGREFEIRDDEKEGSVVSGYEIASSSYHGTYDFTAFLDTKISSDTSINDQLIVQRKKLLYARRKSAKEFYSVSKSDFNDILRVRN